MEGLVQLFDSNLRHDDALLRKVADEHEPESPAQDRDERVRVEIEREGLRQHQNAKADDAHRPVLPGPSPEPARPARRLHVAPRGHLRTAPNVIPRNRCFLSAIVKMTIGSRNSVVAAATAGQFWPPSPMMNGMKGGMVCASELVSKRLNA